MTYLEEVTKLVVARGTDLTDADVEVLAKDWNVSLGALLAPILEEVKSPTPNYSKYNHNLNLFIHSYKNSPLGGDILNAIVLLANTLETDEDLRVGMPMYEFGLVMANAIFGMDKDSAENELLASAVADATYVFEILYATIEHFEGWISNSDCAKILVFADAANLLSLGTSVDIDRKPLIQYKLFNGLLIRNVSRTIPHEVKDMPLFKRQAERYIEDAECVLKYYPNIYESIKDITMFTLNDVDAVTPSEIDLIKGLEQEDDDAAELVFSNMYHFIDHLRGSMVFSAIFLRQEISDVLSVHPLESTKRYEVLKTKVLKYKELSMHAADRIMLEELLGEEVLAQFL